MPANVGDDSPGPRLVRTAFDAKAPVPLETIFACAPLATILNPYLPTDGDEGERLLHVDTILREFLEEREDSESRHPQKRRVGNREEFSPAEYAISFVRLLLYGRVGKGEDDYRTLEERRKAAVTFVGQVETDSRRLARLGTATTWSLFVRELTAYLASRHGVNSRSALLRESTNRVHGVSDGASQDLAEGHRSISIEHDEYLETDSSAPVPVRAELPKASIGSIGSVIRGWWSKRLGKVALIGTSLAGVVAVSIVVAFLAAFPDDLGGGVQETPPDEVSSSAPWRAGWGPAREMFTIESGGAPYPAFNSISNNPNLGDERNFVGLRSATDDASRWRDDVWAKPGETYNMRVYVNNAGLDGNGSVSAGIIQGARLSVGIRNNEGESSVYATLVGKNVTSIYDGATLHVDPHVNIAFDAKDVLLENNAFPGGGFALDSEIFTPQGTLLGYGEMDGLIKPGYQYDLYVVLKVKISYVSVAPSETP